MSEMVLFTFCKKMADIRKQSERHDSSGDVGAKTGAPMSGGGGGATEATKPKNRPVPGALPWDRRENESLPDSVTLGFAVKSEGGHLEQRHVHLHALRVLAADLKS